MSIVQIVFSPTGGTQRVTDIITGEWNMPVQRLDLTDEKISPDFPTLGKEDVAVLSVPSFGGRVPALAFQRIAKIDGNQAKCILICVYGNRAYEDTLTELNDIAEKNGFHVIAAIAAVAEHSIMHQYAAGRPDGEDEEELRHFARRILEKIQTDSPLASPPQIPANHPYKEYKVSNLIPEADESCNLCGHCANICPAHAISQDQPNLTDSSACISCMRCVAKCPQSARKVDHNMVFALSEKVKEICTVRKRNELYL
ncbi:4Fe-4S binding protein [Sellimonas sp.]|uniref:4Fe-4S binding protein n=1 Tax=Sellimonas sp. TaxID=2021466 RepID=UPI000B396DAE|nr:4Fe-4S binding protein [Sellimonas sp.]OUP65277.1 4Fe-4S ferredoxin [Drancourtella sp. An177]